MKIGRFARPLAHALMAALMLASSAWRAAAQIARRSRRQRASSQHKPTPQESALVKAVRDATERFKNVVGRGPAKATVCCSAASAAATSARWGCTSSTVRSSATARSTSRSPRSCCSSRRPNGGVRITGADFLVLAADWDAKHSGPPELMGQLFHLFESPNRFGLPAFYTLHVWAWKDNPNGTFVNWNPERVVRRVQPADSVEAISKCPGRGRPLRPSRRGPV